MTNPYSDLEERAFWAPSVGRRDALDIEALWEPKWPIFRRHKIATFGSCFAQHFGKALQRQGFHWFDAEPAPGPLSPETAQAFNYKVFSARTANIYTVSLLKQWITWALGEPSPQDEVWEKDGRFYDPFRPTIEPNGFASHEEMLASRELTIEAFGRCIREATVFVFTLGLTESWTNEKLGYEYPMCPGTVAGTFDPEVHKFVNQSPPVVQKKLQEALALIRKENSKIRILLTVSPVPLTATMSGAHVLVATTYSKSVLRGAAGFVASKSERVDYFPSYEIISSAPFGGQFFAENKRSVEQDGVDHVMRNFFTCMSHKFPDAVSPDILENLASKQRKPGKKAKKPKNKKKSADQLVCEEELLAAFSPNKTDGVV